MSNVVIVSITLLGIFILFILGKKNKKAHDYTLIFLNLISAGLLLSSLKLATDLTVIFFYIHNTLPFWLFAVFLLYAAQLITNQPWQKYYALFFVLSLPMTLWVTYDVFLAHESFVPLLQSRFLDPPWIYHFFYKGNMIYAIILCIILLRKLNTYTAEIQNNFSYIEKIRLKWLGHYTYILIIIYAFSLIAFVCYNLGFIDDINNIYAILNGFAMLAFFYLSFNGVKHYSIENIPVIDTSLLPKTDQVLESKMEATSNNQIDPARSKKVYEELVAMFEKSKIYTRPQLKLSDVAGELDIPAHQLSLIINSEYGRPFYDFVAKYRVNLLKERLVSSESKQFTILSIGLDCGFNSKASLNRVFKEQTELTPSQYQKSHLPK